MSFFDKYVIKNLLEVVYYLYIYNSVWRLICLDNLIFFKGKKKIKLKYLKDIYRFWFDGFRSAFFWVDVKTFEWIEMYFRIYN